jgi:hypothetical protein
MTWWNSFVSWLTAASNQTVVNTAVVFIVAILIAGVLTALIGRGAIKQLLVQHDRELKAAAIGALIDAATEASVWNSLTPQEQVMADRSVGQADIQVRLLPIRGAGVAADWASHQLNELKRTSATFGYQLEPALLEFRDRLIEWQDKPRRTRKVFQSDLDRWKTQNSSSESSLLAQQDAWAAQQHHDQFNEVLPAAPVPASPTPSVHAASQSTPSTETQRLLDDVQALEVRPAPINHP